MGEIYYASSFRETSGYAAVDVCAYMHMPYSGANPKDKSLLHIEIAGTTSPFSTLNFISTESHRDKFPVGKLHRVAPSGFTYGHRMISGSMMFGTINQSAFYEAITKINKAWNVGLSYADELPPFDIQILMVNDYGRASYKWIYGITILDGSAVYSLDDIALHETYSYMALGMSPLQDVAVDVTTPEQPEPDRPKTTSSRPVAKVAKVLSAPSSMKTAASTRRVSSPTGTPYVSLTERLADLALKPKTNGFGITDFSAPNLGLGW